MSTHKRVITSPEVWAVIKARHHADLQVFSTFSDPNGEYGGPEHCQMRTEYGLPGADFPLMGALTMWGLEQMDDGSTKRVNEHTHYWLCVNTKDDE